jgi:hypothetical protein
MAYYHQASFTKKQLKGQMMFTVILSYTGLSFAVFGLCHDGKQTGKEYESQTLLLFGV